MKVSLVDRMYSSNTSLVVGIGYALSIAAALSVGLALSSSAAAPPCDPKAIAALQQQLAESEAQKATMIEWLQAMEATTEAQKKTLVDWLHESQSSVLSVLK